MRKLWVIGVVLIAGSCLISACSIGESQPKTNDSDQEQLVQQPDSNEAGQELLTTDNGEVSGSEDETPSETDDTGSAESVSADMTQFIGTFTDLSSSEYKKSEIVIKQISEDQIVFDLEAFIVRGGAEGLEKGNVNIGNLNDAVAILDGTTAIYNYEDLGYEMKIEFAADGTFTVTEQGDSPYGYGVSASGQYGVMP
jgi:hypothetical protein